MGRRSIVLVTFCVAALASSPANKGARVAPPQLEQVKERALRQLRAMPLAFEQNVGQTAAARSFVARGQGYTVWATDDGPMLRLGDPRASNAGVDVRIRVVEGASTGQPSPESALRGRVNYFIGNDPSRWATDVPRFAALRYSGVYRGVDLVLHGTQESLEYDFVVAPYADPSPIGVAFDGAETVRIETDGDLTLTMAGGELRFEPPVAYQERDGVRELVPARYDVRADNVVKFVLGEYDTARPLTIDPVISYSTYLGGNKTVNGFASLDESYAVAVDAAGNAYMAGFTNAIDFPMAGTQFDPTCGGCAGSGGDVWVAKIDPSQAGAASLVFATYLGANSNASSIANGVAVDSSGNVYVTGWTGGFDNTATPVNEAFPTTPSAFQPNDGGDLAVSDAFLTKLDANGSSILYSTYLGGNNVDEGYAVKIDAAGKAVVTGRSASATWGVIKNAFQPLPGGVFDAFVAVFDTTASGAGSLTYGTLLGGTSSDAAGALALDALGRIYITGTTQSPTTFPVLNGFQMTGAGGQEAFVSILDPTKAGAASLVYSTYLGGNGTENGAIREGGIAVDSLGIVYVIGTTSGASFPTTPGAYKSVPQSSDVYVVKIDPSVAGAGSLMASTLMGGTFAESGTSLTVDASDNPVVGGWTQSSDFGLTGCGLPINTISAFVTVLDPSLTGLKYSTGLGGSGSDRTYGLAVRSSGEIYVAGTTDSANFPTTVNAYDQTQPGSTDAFLMVIASALDPCPVAPIAAGFATNTPEDTPKALTLTATDLDGNNAPPDALTWAVTTPPLHGTLDVSSGAMTHGFGASYSTGVIYMPAPNYFGPDSFQFRVNDGTANSNMATVTISVTPVNDPPTANSQNVTTAEQTPKSITLTASDPENQFLTFTIGANPGHGVLSGSGASRTYTPSLDFYGQDSFTFFVTDSLGAVSGSATVSITVTNVNDAPTTALDSATTQEDVPATVAVTANDTDVDGDALNVTQVSCNAGSVTINPNQSLQVSPPSNFTGTITCSYTIGDGNGGTANGQLTLQVSSVNDAPTTVADSATTLEDVPVTVAVLANDSDADGDGLIVSNVSCSTGSCGINPNGSVTVTAPPNFNGPIVCSYTASDNNGGLTSGQLALTVTAVNDNPVASPDSATTDDNTLVVVPVLANDVDVDGDAVTLLAAGVCQQGTMTANADGTITYKPNQGFNGTDQCDYTVTDPFGGVGSGLLTVAVTEVNESPMLTNPGDQETTEGSAVSLQLNASDPDGDAVTFTATGLPPGVSIDPSTGLISGAPDPGTAGSHPVSVTIADSHGGSHTIEFTWVVSPSGGTNESPVCSAAAPTIATIWPANHQMVSIEILGVSDPDGGQPSITITGIQQDEPTNTLGDGTTWIDGMGVGTPIAQVRAERTGTRRVPGDGRVYEIFFTASDAQGGTCSASVMVKVPHDQGGAAIDTGVRYDSTVPGGQPLGQP